MIASEALQNRVSCSRLTAPAPSHIQQQALFLAAQRAADHGHLRPWRFLTIESEGLNKLGDLFLAAALKNDSELSEPLQEKFRAMPNRAPMVVVVIVKHQAHPKVPKLEQTMSAAAAAQNIITAAFAEGLGAMWRTGAMATSKHVAEGLGLADHEQIIGFIYLGTPVKPLILPKIQPVETLVSAWP